MPRATPSTTLFLLTGLAAACATPPPAPVTTHRLELFADYHQFYVQDERAAGDLSDAWTPDASARMLAVVDGTIGVGTARAMDVPVTIEVHTTEPTIDLAAWDQVHECSIDVPSGRLVAAGCTDYFPDARRIDLAPGSYRAFVCYGGLDTLNADGLDGNDHYRIVLWPGSLCAPRTRKPRGR